MMMDYYDKLGSGSESDGMNSRRELSVGTLIRVANKIVTHHMTLRLIESSGNCFH